MSKSVATNTTYMCLYHVENYAPMFGLFKRNPQQKLEKQYHALLKQAMEAQRSGDIRSYSEISEKADGIYQQILALQKTESNP